MFSRLRIFFLLILLPYFAIAQTAKFFHPFGWGTYSTSFSDVFCGLHNQAGLAELKHFTAGAMAQRRFMLKALTTYTFALALPTTSGTFCLQGNHLGYKNFNRQQLGLAYGRKLWPWLNVGIQLDYLNMHIPRYGSAHTITFETAFLVHLNKQWHAGVQIFNPVNVNYNGLGDDAIPVVYRIGIGYQPSENFLLSMEASQVERSSMTLALAFYYHIAKAIGFTGGAATGEEKVFLGMVLYLEQFKILFAGAYHSRLGISPSTGFIFENK
jgi:hypothetical protein